MEKRFIITGGAGFIGSNFIRYMMSQHPRSTFVNLDKLTYSGNLANLRDIEKQSSYHFFKGDICNKPALADIIKEGDIIVNFAAESHVDNSLLDSGIFIKTNVLGVQTLLDVAREKKASLFIQISTDEVYGSLSMDSISSKEAEPLRPSSPYSASKAAAEMLCFAAIKTFAQPIIITRSSNNFGPYQFPEKVIPLFITNLLEDKTVPLYGNGLNVRDWIYVQDNCAAIDLIIQKGRPGEIYNIGGGDELTNKELTLSILQGLAKEENNINFVADRLGHDLRYSVDSSKIRALGWAPQFSFEEALKYTIMWYKENSLWWQPLKKTPGKRTS